MCPFYLGQGLKYLSKKNVVKPIRTILVTFGRGLPLLDLTDLVGEVRCYVVAG